MSIYGKLVVASLLIVILVFLIKYQNNRCIELYGEGSRYTSNGICILPDGSLKGVVQFK
jgi:hypothetical protein